MLPHKWTSAIHRWWDPMRGYHFLILMACLTSSLIPVWMKLVMGGLAVANLLVFHDLVERISTIVYAISITAAIYVDYFAAANHIFLLCYFTLFIALWRNDLIQYFNFPRYLVIVVLLIATVHKLASVHFMEGSLMGEYILHGESFTSIASWVFPELPELINKYTTAYEALEQNPQTPVSTTVPISADIYNFLQGISWSIALVEVTISLLLIFGRPYVRYLGLLVFLFGTLLFRTEFYFFGTLCLLTLFDEDLFKTKLSVYYILTFVGFMIATGYLVYTWKYV